MNSTFESEKLATESFIENSEFIKAGDSYHDNTAFGGQLFAWMDNAAAICVMRHCGQKAVTASVDALYFLRPVNVGYIVNVQARLIATYQSSCQVRTFVWASLPKIPERTLTAVGYFTMVALSSAGKPERLPKLKIESDADHALVQLARELKQLRQSLRDRLTQVL